MNTPNDQLRSPRKKTACAECRQQKMRCEKDPATSDSSPCSRCRRLNISCVFSAPFKRTNKRKRLQELEGETSALRQLLSAAPAAHAEPVLNGVSLPPRQEERVDLPQSLIEKKTRINDPTLPRTIGGLELASIIIDDCFELYFKDYHSMVPILDPSITPNTIYQHAQSLFWVIVAIGSRRYARQPTLIGALALPVTQLVLQSIVIRTKPIERIKAMILLLNWPFPSGPFYREPSFLLSGSLLHMAMHCGLHTFSEDFSKSSQGLAEKELVRRACIWAYVVVTYQRTCSAGGQANLVSFEIYNERASLKTLLDKLPATLRIQTQISNITSRAHKAFVELRLLSMTPQQERTLVALLKGYETELDALEHLVSSRWDRLYIAIARQDLAAMQFYKSETTLLSLSCISIFNATSSVLEQILDLDKHGDLHRTCTQFFLTATLQSLACMARVLKGPFAGYLDQTRGSNLINTAICFSRSCSLQKGDFADRCAAIAEKIWKSKKVFREPDGSINIALRVRNRLSSGPWHDAVRCWQEEFVNPDCAAYVPGIDADTAAPSGATAGLETESTPTSAAIDLPSLSSAPDLLLDSEMWGDFGLELSDSWDMPGSSMSWMA